MNIIARYTTPSIAYHPTAAKIEDIEKVFCVLSQYDKDLVIKEINDAFILDDTFYWELTQEETAVFNLKANITIQIDYITASGIRYTTLPRKFSPINSAITEVI